MGDRPIHFEIPVDDVARAEKFYSSAFGWDIQSFPGSPSYYGLAGTGEGEAGINGALMERSEGNAGIRLTMGVASIEESIAKIEAGGGKVIQGKMPIPGMGYFATCEDTEGNPIGVFTSDPTATM